MSSYVTLLGAEQVQSAGCSMQHAADQMQRAASQIDEALYRHQVFLEDWLMRLGGVLEDRLHDLKQAVP